ncbi:hypothetical protein OEZ86_006540 [Tetradesmus obliquus]|nr:hypothetical protein OEZ86_006540 [Tetradesmus obliquus]
MRQDCTTGCCSRPLGAAAVPPIRPTAQQTRLAAKPFISPAQDQMQCAACVGFAFTAAAEAAVNVHLKQSWNDLSLSEQDISFCRLLPRVDCGSGMSYEDLTKNVVNRTVEQWASRECWPYQGYATTSCARANACPSQLPKGGAFSMAYGGSALNSIGKVKSQIMLNGGVLTSIAMSQAVFKRFEVYNTNAVFDSTDDLSQEGSTGGPEAAAYMHALFCYGWQDTANGDGYWLCKNSWSSNWGDNGNIKLAYGAAYIMQRDYTFAVHPNPIAISQSRTITANRASIVVPHNRPAYSSNSTADTPGRRAFISPAQDQGVCSACVGFVFTATAEAAVNVYLQQSWNKLSLSEQDISFCKLLPRVNCMTGLSFSDLLQYVAADYVKNWASRACFPYEGDSRDCRRAAFCPSQLPEGGRFSMAYESNALSTISMVKSQIMLNGGVITSIAMSDAGFERLKAYDNTFAVFDTSEDLSLGVELHTMHALFCYGWRDTVNGQGHWLCKNSWSPNWGNNGNIKIAYGAAYVMQPDNTFALQFRQDSREARAAAIKAQLKPGVM